ncbi:MAG: Gfo/Idh/MocA family oxidoreductase, partial [Flavitalea sp.]
MNRKDFVKTTGLALTSMAVMPSITSGNTKADPKVKVAMIGVGLRGQNRLDLLLRRNDVDVVAICDIDDQMLASSKKMITTRGKKMPQVYTGDPYAWKKMLDAKGIDAIVIATP